MKSHLVLLTIAVALVPVTASAVTVNFSQYPSTPDTVISGGPWTSGPIISSNDYLLDNESNTAFKVYGATALRDGSTYAATVKDGGTANYLELTTARGSSATGSQNPYSSVSSQTAFDPTVPGQVMTWSTDFNISTKGNGEIRFGLYAFNAMSNANGSYQLNQTSGYTDNFNSSTIGLSLSLNQNNGVLISRTGSDNSNYIETWRSSSGWVDGVSTVSGSLTWSVDTNYSVSITVDTTTGDMTLVWVNKDTDTMLLTVTSSLSELSSQATAGGFRYSIGNLETNSTYDYTINVDNITVVPEPSVAACLLSGMLLLTGARRIRSRAARQA